MRLDEDDDEAEAVIWLEEDDDQAEAVMRQEEDEEQAEAFMRLRIRLMTKLRLS